MTGAKILYLHNAPAPWAPGWLSERISAAGFATDVFRACDEAFPERVDGYAGAVLTGSPHGAYEDIPWIAREHRLIEDLAAHGVPTLGICFGSQILASALLDRDQVFRRDDCEVGYKGLRLTEAAAGDPVTKDLRDRFPMFVWHNDEVRAGHPEMTVLASSDACPTQVWRRKGLPAWGILGHAEVARDQAPAWFEARRRRMEKDGADVDALIARSDGMENAKTMFANFLAVCGP